MNKLYFCILFIFSIDLYAQINKEVWDGYNNPFRLDQNFISKFIDLPMNGKMNNEKLSWPGTYWPNYKGSIAWRWNSDRPLNFRYRSPSYDQAQLMTNEEINQLSPAEKYDLYVGDYNYPTVKKMWRSTSPRSPLWYGICHGVAPAGIHYPEPQTVTLMSKDGIEITFYSSDVKALLANFYAREATKGITMVGKRCFWRWFGSACTDINPGAFHIILANKLGIKGEGFITDLDRNRQVWNHAPVSYSVEVVDKFDLNEKSSNVVVERIEVKTIVKYTASIDPQQNPVIGTGIAEYDERTYRYYLDINSLGQITGGSWLSWARPDFVWYQEKEEFTGYWQSLNEIYQPTSKGIL